MKQFVIMLGLTLCSVLYTTQVAAVPPYIGIDMAEALTFGDASCVEVAKKILTDDGFAEVQKYKGGTTVFAAYRNQADYEYKAAVRCLNEHGMVTVVVVANAPGKALKKANHLLALIQAQAGGKQIQGSQKKKQESQKSENEEEKDSASENP